MINFLGNFITIFYNWTGNFGVAVIIFTLIVKGLLLPLDIKSKNSNAKMQELQPEVQKISEKYKNDPEKKNRKIQELYQKKNVSPLGGCLPMLITLPIVIIVFYALRRVASQTMYNFLSELLIANNGDMRDVLAQIGTAISNSAEIKMSFADILPMLFANPTAYEDPANLVRALQSLPSVIGEETYMTLIEAIKGVTETQILDAIKVHGYQFLWVKNIMVSDSGLTTIIGTGMPFSSIFQNSNGYFILPILSTALQYLQTWLTMRNQPKNTANNSGAMSFMNKIFPIISLYFCTMYSAAFALYWTMSTIISVAQILITDWVRKNKKKKQAQLANA